MKGKDGSHTQPLPFAVAKQGNLVLPYVRRLRPKRVFSIKAGVIRFFFHTAELFDRGCSH